MARKLANESMVLLKNDGVLPLKTSGIKIAVVGPLADQTKVLLGNYNGIPTHTVSILEGLRKEFPGATINYVPGTQFLSASESRACARGPAHHRRQARRQGQLLQARYRIRTESPARSTGAARHARRAHIDTAAKPCPQQPPVSTARCPLGGDAYPARNRRLQPRR